MCSVTLVITWNEFNSIQYLYEMSGQVYKYTNRFIDKLISILIRLSRQLTN